MLLPGRRYFSQAPLLWFAREAAQAEGWSALELSERAPADREQFDWMRERAAQALAAAPAGTLAVVGKSLASAAAPLVTARAIPAVWLTPLLVRREIADALAAVSAPTLAIGSGADPSWSEGSVPEARSLEVIELDGLDHSLQVAGDPAASLEVLGTVTERIRSFLSALA